MPSTATQLVRSMDRSHLAGLCKTFGATLQSALAGSSDGMGKPIDAALLLWAMSGRESMFGHDLGPRHEPAYDIGGSLYRQSEELQQGIALYGRDFACSYGPLQIMAVNAKGCTPRELGSDPDLAMGAAVARLRIHVLGAQGARTIGDICDCWNTGNDKDRLVPTDYIAYVRHLYITEVLA